MFDPLQDAKLKVRRANQHLKELDGRIRWFVKNNDYAFNSHYDAKRGGTLYVWGGGYNTPPDYWRLLIGDIVANLRSALDYIVWQLSQKGAGSNEISSNEARDIYFPILDEPNPSFLRRHTKFVHPNARGVIEALQPYNRSKRPELSLLWYLHELSNWDKHRIITRIAEDTALTLSDGNVPPGVTFNDFYLVFVPDDQTHLQPRLMIDISLGLRGYDEWISSRHLSQISDFIRDEVIPCFVRFLPPESDYSLPDIHDSSSTEMG